MITMCDLGRALGVNNLTEEVEFGPSNISASHCGFSYLIVSWSNLFDRLILEETEVILHITISTLQIS